ncbi:MAG: c-type cytochrome domain-containing protein [Planctomycetota bacterium]
MRFVIAVLLLTSVAVAQDRVDFEKQVLPILERSCGSCHGSPKAGANGRRQRPKAGLVLDTRAGLERGGESGEILVPGDPEQSHLHYVVTRSPDDPEFMPAKGDALTKEQTDLIARWIREGADFGDWTGRSAAADAETEGQQAPVPVKRPSRFEMWEALGEGVRPASEMTIAKARRVAHIEPVIPGSSLLRVEFFSREAETNDDVLSELSGIADNITVLKLGRTDITDGAAATISQMKRLTWLDASETELGDKALNKLKGLQELRLLNLYGTPVTDRGLRSLEKMTKLEDVHLLGSEVTKQGIERLREHLAAADIRFELTLPEVPDAPATPRRRR